MENLGVGVNGFNAFMGFLLFVLESSTAGKLARNRHNDARYCAMGAAQQWRWTVSAEPLTPCASVCWQCCYGQASFLLLLAGIVAAVQDRDRDQREG